MNGSRLSDLLDMSLIQTMTDSNFRAGGLPVTIVDALDSSILVKAALPEVCRCLHRDDPLVPDSCIAGSRYFPGLLRTVDVCRYKCWHGLCHISIPIIVAGQHMGTMFLTRFVLENQLPELKRLAARAAETGVETGYLAALDRIPVFSAEKVHSILEYNKVLVHFIADLAERSLGVTGTKKLLSEEDRTVKLAHANGLLMAEIAERQKVEEKLRDLSEKDHLTMIFNRRKLFELLALEIDKAKRYKRPLSMILLDLDHFKNVNDRYGHNAGDAVLKTTADVIDSVVRKTDIFARYGGEEFVILSPETGREGAMALAEKIRASVEFHDFPFAGKITVSAGVSVFSVGDSVDAFIDRTDRALYSAKRGGRNRIAEDMKPAV
jgi:diguanylate cyclase (GGDEF)-like protein